MNMFIVKYCKYEHSYNGVLNDIVNKRHHERITLRTPKITLRTPTLTNSKIDYELPKIDYELPKSHYEMNNK